MQTRALDTPIFLRRMLAKRYNQFFTFVQNRLSIFMMIHPMAEMGKMSNHGALAPVMVNIVDEKGDETKKVTLVGRSYRNIFCFMLCARLMLLDAR